jgi:superfamily II DNA helicase RecQ
MKLQVFSLRWMPEGGFDDTELALFMETHEVLSVYEHMVYPDGVPTWAVMVSYRPSVRAPASKAPPVEREAALDVPEADRLLFERLRHWRNDRARRDGRPTYVVFRNNQLADIARVRPSSMAQLGALAGVGEAKCRDYGAEVLALLAEEPLEAPAVPAAVAEAPRG